MKLFNKLAIAASLAVSLSFVGGNKAQAFTPVGDIFTNEQTGNQYFLTDNLTWYDAQDQAVEAGGNLVTVNDAAEQAWLETTFGGSELFWLGLTDQGDEGNFKWVSGQEVTYTNWLPGEPNNWAGIEHHVVSNWDIKGKWNDYPGSGYRAVKGIVEIEAAQSVPEPASILGLLAFGTFATTSTLKSNKKKKAE